MKVETRRWIVCGFLLGATIINYLDRQTISVSASHIADEMGLTDGDLGKLFSAFLFAYGIGQILVGPILDRMSVVVAYAAAVGLWSLAGASSALATNFMMLFGARLLLGVFEAPNWPVALRVVGRVFPPSQRSLASGVFQSGTSIGALIAPPIIIALIVAYGWRSGFVAMGAIGLVWVAAWLLWMRKQPAELLDEHDAGEVRADAAPARDITPTTVRGILRSRVFWGLLLANNIVSPLQYFYTTWLARYFDHYTSVGFGKELAARLIVVYLALDIGLWVSGSLVLWLSKLMTVRRARIWVTSFGALCMCMIPLVSQMKNINAITATICVSTFGLGMFMVNYLSNLTEVSKTRTSTVAGISGGTGSLTGAFFVWLIGYTVDATGGFALAFTMAGTLPLLALAGMWWSTTGAEKRERDAAIA